MAPWANSAKHENARPHAKVVSIGLGPNAVDTSYRQHYEYAKTGKVEDNGGGDDVQSFASMSTGKHPGGMGKHLRDGARGAGKPIRHTRGRFPAQASPDHGDHDGFGTG